MSAKAARTGGLLVGALRVLGALGALGTVETLGAVSALGALCAFGTVGCAHDRAPVFSPKAIDDIAADCRRRIDAGAVERWRRTTHEVGTRTGRASRTSEEDAPVVIYGASWCRACDAAAQYLTQRHVGFVEKDVEIDPEAEHEARAALAEAALAVDLKSLPVVTVGNTVMIGFRPCVLEDALARDHTADARPAHSAWR